MPKCVAVKRLHTKPCIGDMDTLISIQNRNISPPVHDSVDYTEDFTNIDDIWALINTPQGSSFFDGAGTETNITHDIMITFDPLVTSESWIKLADSRRLDILDIKNLEERSEYMMLRCNDRGSSVASQA